MLICVAMVVMVTIFDKQLAIEGAEDTLLDEKPSLRVGLVGKLSIGFEHVLMVAVDIEVVGVGGSDDSHVWMQLQEGAVKFVSLDDDIFAFLVNPKVAVKILSDASQKGSTAARSRKRPLR